MKKSVIILLGVLCAVQVFGQGTQGSVFFNNRYLSGIGAPIVAPVYGPQVGDPSRQIRGNATTNGGTQTYSGPLLIGTGFTAALFGGAPGITDESSAGLTLVASAPFRTGPTTGGFFNAPTTAFMVPGTVAGGMATFQLRAWDNQNGTLTTWASVLAAPASVARGSSALFTPQFPLGGPTESGVVTPPGLHGLTSFNIVVPEPGVIALGVLGLGALLFRRRK